MTDADDTDRTVTVIVHAHDDPATTDLVIRFPIAAVEVERLSRPDLGDGWTVDNAAPLVTILSSVPPPGDEAVLMWVGGNAHDMRLAVLRDLLGRTRAHDADMIETISDDVWAWIDYGVTRGWCTSPVCDMHDDGAPTREWESEAIDEGYDPCIPIVRLWNDDDDDGGSTDE